MWMRLREAQCPKGQSLSEFIEDRQDKREIQRAIAVKMLLEGYKHEAIQTVLGVPSGFISKWKKAFFREGVEGLKLAYKGSQGFLNPQQRHEVIEWLKTKDRWNLNELDVADRNTNRSSPQSRQF